MGEQSPHVGLDYLCRLMQNEIGQILFIQELALVGAQQSPGDRGFGVLTGQPWVIDISQPV